MVYKLTKVYTNDIGHQYGQEHLPVAYHNLKVSSQVSQPTMLHAMMLKKENQKIQKSKIKIKNDLC